MMDPAHDFHLPGVLASVIAVLLSISLFVFLTSHGGTPIGIYDNGIGDHWPSTHRNLTIVDRTGDAGWHQALADAVATWTQGGSALHLRLTATDTAASAAGASPTAQGDCGQHRDRIEVCQATTDDISAKGSAGEQGLFVPQVARNHEYRSAILLVCSDCEIDQDRMTVIATHELGHALGLAHSLDPESVMYYLGGSAHPDANDLQVLRQREGSALVGG
ncbi:MAG: Matrixin [Acidimicrobiaceae bacterium]|nr:Matrixin [Acidimicrobiaceae bacterium]